ncbi:MAG: hypothetical protein FWC28_08255 [Proteobacteria bacterium]|nr:hypothetical protein [Pseudomonadota bacterium]
MLILALCFLSLANASSLAPTENVAPLESPSPTGDISSAGNTSPPEEETLPPLPPPSHIFEETPPPAAKTTSEITDETPPPPAPPQTTELAPQANSMAPGFSFYGLYPLWENTGNMLGHRRIFIGNNWLAVGFAHRFSLGLRPTSFFFRVPNFDFKALVYERAQLKVSMQLAPSLVLPGASTSFTTNNFVSRFDDNHHYLWLLPLSANASWQLLDELCLHASLTALGAFGKQVPNLQVTLGLTVFAEFMAWKYHSLMLHLGETGFWNHDLAMLGASYRFHWKWIEAQLGYFYRFSVNGNQGGFLIALGVLL